MKNYIPPLVIFIFCTFFDTLAQENTTTTSEGSLGNVIIDIDTVKNQSVTQNRKVIRAFAFKTENDFFGSFLGLKNDDKDYTGGFQFEFYTDYLKGGILLFFMNRAARKSNTKNLNSIYIAGLGFTPSRNYFSISEPVLTQRPYASLVLIGKKRIAVFDSTRLFGHRDFSVLTDFYTGVIGGGAVGNAQNWIHRNITNSDEVFGWHNQIGNGGKMVFNYIFSPSLGLYKSNRKKKHNIYLNPHLSVGNIHRNLGLRVSLSNLTLKDQPVLQSMNSAMADSREIEDYGSGDKFDAPIPNSKFLKRFKYDIYARCTRVFHNSLLNGMPIKRYDTSPYVIDKSNTSNYVVDLGLRVYYPYLPYRKKKDQNFQGMKRMTTVYIEVVNRSKEFSFGPNHTFLSVGYQILNLD